VKPTSIDSGKASLALLENGVIALTWQPNASVEISDVAAAMAKVNELCNGLAHPLLVEMTGVGTVTHEARAAFSTECAASRIALLGSTPVDQVIANFRSADSYPCPTRFFTNRTEALNWLLQVSPY
jgi:hypothetical protein